MDNRVCTKCGRSKSITHFQTMGGSNKNYRRVCRECRNIQRNIRQRENKESLYAWRREHPEIVREYRRRYWNKNRYSIVLKSSKSVAKREGYIPCLATKDEIEKAFSGKCHICGVPEAECKRRLNMDHDHNTGQFRGWLCDNCNRALGHLKNSEEIILNMAIYIEQSNKGILNGK